MAEPHSKFILLDEVLFHYWLKADLIFVWKKVHAGHEKIIHLSQRFSSTLCLFKHVFISSKNAS